MQKPSVVQQVLLRRWRVCLVAALSLGLVATVALAAPTATAQSQAPTPPTTTTAASTTLAAAKHQRTPVRYVALGDSYTAAPFVPVTDPANGCYRSLSNYPRQVALALNASSFTDVSCSGATTDHARNAQYPGAVGPQLDAVRPDTTLVTIGLGGNDEGLFSDLITTCMTLAVFDPAGQPCTQYFTSLGQHSPQQILRRTTARVASTVQAVRQRAPQAKVLVVGYPMLVPRTGTCENLPIADGDYQYVRTTNEALSRALMVGARRAGARYIDVARASRGHDLCASQPWVNGALTDPLRAQAFHPFFEEQVAVAHLILDNLKR